MARVAPVAPAITAKGRSVIAGVQNGAAAAGLYPPDETTRAYSGSRRGGIWSNANGTQVGYSPQEDSKVTPMKSTGDVPSLVASYVKQRKQAGTKGY